MRRYIDADALKERLIQNIALTNAIDRSFSEAPSIDIVRCAECIWRDKDNQGEDYCTYVKGLADINEDSFCSWGKCKESE